MRDEDEQSVRLFIPALLFLARLAILAIRYFSGFSWRPWRPFDKLRTGLGGSIVVLAFLRVLRVDAFLGGEAFLFPSVPAPTCP
jgi:hypothetical protein